MKAAMRGAERRQQGFTLLELVVAITLMGLVLVVLYSGLRLGLNGWDSGERRAEASNRLRSVQEFLRRQLAQSMTVYETNDDRRERFVVFAGAFLDAEHHVAVHLNKATVAIPGEASVAGGFFETDDGVVVQSEVQNRVHHAGHGVASAGADSDEEGHAGFVTELGSHDGFDLGDAIFDLTLEVLGIGAFGVVVS